MAHPGVKPLFDQLMDSGKLKENVFSFFLSFDPNVESSELTLGYYDTKHYYPKTLNWHPVVHRVFFAIELLDVRIGKKSLELCGKNSRQEKKCTITPDSGTSQATMPDWAIK